MRFDGAGRAAAAAFAAAIAWSCSAPAEPRIGEGPAAGSSEATHSASRPHTDPRLAAMTAQITPVVEKLRGLSFLRPVAQRVCTREELLALIERDFDEEFPPEDRAAFSGMGKLLGLLPPEYDFDRELRDLMQGSIAGFYDTARKELFVLEDLLDSEEARSTLAHELLHALEDQHFNLQGIQDAMEALEPNATDRAFAFTCVAEGSAQSLEEQFLFSEEAQALSEGAEEDAPEAQPLDEEPMEEEEAGGTAEALLTQTPPILMRMLVEPYFAGRTFLARGGGMLAPVKKSDLLLSYGAPPLSSEQIFHPEKYWDRAQRDDPQTVVLPDLSANLGAGWRRLGSGELGEMGAAVMTTDPEEAEDEELVPQWMLGVRSTQAAEGWDGDRYEVYQSAQGALVCVWISVWDSEKDALEMDEALPRPFGVEREIRRRGAVLAAAFSRQGPKGEALGRLADFALAHTALRAPQPLDLRPSSSAGPAKGAAGR